MSKEAVTQLFRAAQTDTQLREQLNSAPDINKFIEMAHSRGYDFTVEEWQEMTGFSVEELKCDVSDIPGI